MSGHRAAPSITGPRHFAPCNLLQHDTDSDIDDDDTHSVASVEYEPRDHFPRRVTFARGKDKQCSYNPDKKYTVLDKHPWPGFLDFNFYTTCNNGKVTDVYPWPDFLDFEHPGNWETHTSGRNAHPSFGRANPRHFGKRLKNCTTTGSHVVTRRMPPLTRGQPLSKRAIRGGSHGARLPL